LRGGYSTLFRGLLAHYLNTEIPSKVALCCHACSNDNCSNPKHLYWGTYKENLDDARSANPKLYKRLAKKSSIRLKLNNKFKGCKPWEASCASHQSWLKAGIIYEDMLKCDWNFNDGRWVMFLVKKYDIAIGSSKRMLKMFRDRWNPFKDKNWIIFADKYSKKTSC